MARLGKAENIVVGAASLYISAAVNATDPTIKPAYEANKSYRDTLDASPAWVGVGYTQEGLEVSYEPDFGNVDVDQLLDAALTFKQGMTVSLNTTLAEATLFNLMISWGQAASTLTSTASDAEIDIAGGELGDAPKERSFIAVGNAPRKNGVYGERVYHAYRTLNVEASSHSLRRNENVGIPVSFRALPADTGSYGKIKDRTRTW